MFVHTFYVIFFSFSNIYTTCIHTTNVRTCSLSFSFFFECIHNACMNVRTHSLISFSNVYTSLQHDDVYECSYTQFMLLFFSFLNIYIYNACANVRIRYYFFLFQTCIYYKPGTRICQNPYPIMGVRVALGNPRITRANPYISLPLPN